MEEKFEEGVEKGMDLGCEQGYKMAKESFDKIIKAVKVRESSKVDTSDAGAQTDSPDTSTRSISTQTNPIMFAVTSQSPEPFKNSKTHSTSKSSPIITVIPLSTPSTTILNPVECSTTTTALETRPMTISFTQKLEKLNIPSIFLPKITPTLSPCTVEETNDVARIHTSTGAPNDAISHPNTPKDSQVPSVTKDEKSALLRAVFESQPPTEFPAPTTITTCTRTRPPSSDFVENGQKVENSPIFNQNHPEHPKSPVLDHFNWADEASELPTSYLAPTSVVTGPKTCSAPARSAKICKKSEKSPIFNQIHPKSLVSESFSWAANVESPLATSTAPTKLTRDLSCLRSSSTNPFSSLCRRRRNHKRLRHFTNLRSQFNCQHVPQHTPQPPLSSSLNWDRDPRLIDLCKSLRALGWVRQ
jgi:hypothetical protein